MRTQEKLMRDAGYVTAADAAQAIGADNVGTIHRQVKTGKLVGARAGVHWYVLVKSLLEAHADAPPILARIRELGVEAKDPPPGFQNGAGTPAAREDKPSRRKARGRRSA